MCSMHGHMGNRALWKSICPVATASVFSHYYAEFVLFILWLTVENEGSLGDANIWAFVSCWVCEAITYATQRCQIGNCPLVNWI